MKPLLCVRHEITDSMGVAIAVFERNGHSVRKADAWDPNLDWPEPRDVAGVVVFGGDMNADEVDRHPYLLPERDLIRKAVDAEVPVLGVCLGAQLLARAMEAAVSRSPVREFGFRPVYPTPEGERDLVLSSIRPGDRIFQWHRDTFELPRGGVLLATGEQVRNQAYRVGERAWGIQFHPEVTADNLDLWLSMQEPESLASEWGRGPDEVRGEAARFLGAQHERAEDLFGRFARVAANGN